MVLVYDHQKLIQRSLTALCDEKGRLYYTGIYDFAYKYRTRIFDPAGNEAAYVEKDVSAKEEIVCFYDGQGKQTGSLIRKEDCFVLLPEETVFEENGDGSYQIGGLLQNQKGILKVENQEDLLKAVMVLFSMIEIKR